MNLYTFENEKLGPGIVLEYSAANEPLFFMLGSPGDYSSLVRVELPGDPSPSRIVHHHNHEAYTTLVVKTGQFVAGQGATLPSVMPAEPLDDGVIVRVNQVNLPGTRGRSKAIFGTPVILTHGWRGVLAKNGSINKFHDTLWHLRMDQAIMVSPAGNKGNAAVIFYDGENLFAKTVTDFCDNEVLNIIEFASPSDIRAELGRADQRKLPWVKSAIEKAVAHWGKQLSSL